MPETLDIIVTGVTETIEIDTGLQVVEIETDTQIVIVEGQGEKGDQGLNASLLLLEIEVEENIPSSGWPIAINRATGKGKLARADSYPLSFVVGFSKDSCAAGFVVELERYAMELTDWTAIIGTQYLSAVPAYFLGKTGGLTAVADYNGLTMVNLGIPLNAQTLEINLNTPILL
jgi:hypothetical protein